MLGFAKFSIKLAETLEWPQTNMSSERGDALEHARGCSLMYS
jgi:hypothetical protein